MQCHKDGCGSFTIQSGPFRMLYHGEQRSISNTDIKIRVSSDDLYCLVNCRKHQCDTYYLCQINNYVRMPLTAIYASKMFVCHSRYLCKQKKTEKSSIRRKVKQISISHKNKNEMFSFLKKQLDFSFFSAFYFIYFI